VSVAAGTSPTAVKVVVLNHIALFKLDVTSPPALRFAITERYVCACGSSPISLCPGQAPFSGAALVSRRVAHSRMCRKVVTSASVVSPQSPLRPACLPNLGLDLRVPRYSCSNNFVTHPVHFSWLPTSSWPTLRCLCSLNQPVPPTSWARECAPVLFQSKVRYSVSLRR
jgi:hypothetical protein